MNMNLKKIISSVAALALSASCFTAFAADFTDVPDTLAAKTAIDDLVALKVVNGYEDGTFKPDNEITRAEVTKMVVAAMGPTYTAAAESSKGTTDFSDAAGHWAEGFINTGVAQGFINGMGDGTFSPDTNVTYAQIVKMLVSVLGYTSAAEGNGGFPNGYLQIGSSIGVTTGVSGVNADTAVTRAQVAQLIDNAIATPIVAVTGWTNDIYGKPVATTEVMDGTGDSEKYKTLLTENHDAYKVKGRVTATHAQGTDIDKVNFDVEYADNYDGEKYDLRKDNTSISITPYFGDTKAEDYLFTYAEALIQMDEDDEEHIISITPYGKNDILELAADDYDSIATDESTIDFTIADSSKTKSYKLSSNAKLYVNGVASREATLTDSITKYVDGNDCGTVTLIDTPSAGTTSKDGKYDYIMVSYYNWGIVDSVSDTAAVKKIYLSNSDGLKTISLDTDDEDFVYSISKDGSDIEVADIKEDDVLLVAYDVVANSNVKDSSFVTIIVSDAKAEGKVTKTKLDDGKIVYTMGDQTYKYVGESSTATTSTCALKIGNEYTLYLDAFGRIIDYDEVAASNNYGVIDRVYKDNNLGEDKVRVIKGDGTRVTYTVKDSDVQEDASTIAYGSSTALDGQPGVALTALAGRFITYKLNSNSEIHTINALSMTLAQGEYSENSKKVLSAKMSDSTVIVDMKKAVSVSGSNVTNASYTASDIKAASLTSFQDGENYSVYYGDRANDGTYRFVAIIEGNAAIGVSSSFAVVDGVSEGEYGETGTTLKLIDMYIPGNDELQSIFVSDDMSTVQNANPSTLSRGDVVAYGLDSDGNISDLKVVFKLAPLVDTKGVTFANANTFNAGNAANFIDKNAAATTATGSFFYKSGIAKWDSSKIGDSNGYARVAFGAVVDKSASSLTLAAVTTAAGKNVSGTDDIHEIDFANDVNVYTYDFNEKSDARISTGTAGSIVKTYTSGDCVIEDANGDDTYAWEAEDAPEYANYAFVKTVDNEITDVFFIIPNED